MWLKLIVVTSTAILLGGCGKKAPNLVEVEGTLTLHGKPFPKATVCFVPDFEAGTFGLRSSGVTDEKGHYRLVSDYWQKPGALVGKHSVVVCDPDAVNKDPLKNIQHYPGKYMTPWKTPLHVEVAPGGPQVIDLNVE